MPKETDRLKLPLPLGNENVTRESINGIFEKIDAGVATQADLDTLREAVSKMDIPDASLTQKGKVQLSSKTDGTSETVAATEKAVCDARVAAETNAVKIAYNQLNELIPGVSNLLRNSTGMLGKDFWSSSQLWSVNTGLGDSPASFVIESTASADMISEPIGNSSNKYFTLTLSAEFYTLGVPSLGSGSLLVQVLNSTKEKSLGFIVADWNENWHKKSVEINIDIPGPYYVKIYHSSSSNSNVKAVRRIMLTSGNINVPYNNFSDTLAVHSLINEVKQSGVDAKKRIVDAINAKGGSASTSDTWVTLQSRIRSIYQGKKFASGSVDGEGSRNFFLTDRDGANYYRSFIQVSGLGFTPSNIIAYPTQYRLDSQSKIAVYNSSIIVNGYEASFAGEIYRVDGTQAYVKDGSFLLPTFSSGTYRWFAYE